MVFFEIIFMFMYVVGLVVLLCSLLLAWLYWSELLCVNLFREVMSSFECGFDSKDMSRLPFSLRFFLIVMFFILLDIEVCLLLQLPYEFLHFYYIKRIWFFLFLVMLAVGMVEELRRGFLSWKVYHYNL